MFILVLLLVQVPPMPVLVNVVELPIQTVVAPLMAPGTVLTASVRFALVETPQFEVAVKVYIPAAAVLLVNAAGASTVEVKPLGPAQL